MATLTSLAEFEKRAAEAIESKDLNAIDTICFQWVLGTAKGQNSDICRDVLLAVAANLEIDIV